MTKLMKQSSLIGRHVYYSLPLGCASAEELGITHFTPKKLYKIIDAFIDTGTSSHRAIINNNLLESKVFSFDGNPSELLNNKLPWLLLSLTYYSRKTFSESTFLDPVSDRNPQY